MELRLGCGSSGCSSAATGERVRSGVRPMWRRAYAAALTISLLTSGISGAEAPGATTGAANSSAESLPPSQSPDAVQSPLPDIGKGAEHVAAVLRELTESLSDAPVFLALEAEVDADCRRVSRRWSETRRLLEGKPRPPALDTLASSWEALRSELEDVSGRIEARRRR